MLKVMVEFRRKICKVGFWWKNKYIIKNFNYPEDGEREVGRRSGIVDR